VPIPDARHYKTLLICPSKTLAAEVEPLLAHGLPLAPVHPVPVYPNRKQIIDLLKGLEPSLCLLDLASNETQALEVLADLHNLVSSLPIVALLPGNNSDLMLRCLRQGASDFLIQPFTTDQIDACIEKIARILPAPPSKAHFGKTIAIMPAKGASGSTTIASNLAFQAKRLGAKSILLGDMDPLAGTVSFVLKLKSSYSFMDVLQRQGSLDSDLWKQMVVTTQGIDVLLSPESIVDPIMELQTAGPILDYAQNAYEAIVLDCSSTFGNWNLSIARAADEIVLVSTTDLPSLQSAQRAMAYLEHHRVDASKVKLVVNRYTKDIGLHVDNVAKAFQTEVFQTIPNDADIVQKSLMEGRPIQANSQVGRNLAALAERLMTFKAADSKKAAPKAGLFSSIFR
jgi:pilus assembly protein CpaE